MTETDVFNATLDDLPYDSDPLGNLTALFENTTGNLASDDLLGPRYHKRVRISIIVTMIVVSIVGNGVVCCNLLVKHRHRRVSKARVLFLNLAIADLLVACVTMTSQVVWEVMGRLWIAGDAFCRFFKFLQTFALVSSTYMLGGHRRGPAHRHRHPTGAQSRPVEVGRRHVGGLVHAVAAQRIYMGFVFFMVFVVPLVLLIAFHTGILWTLWKHSATGRKVGQQTTSSLPRAKVKTLKMTAVVFGAFLVTNVPYMVQEVILAFGNPGILDANVVALFGVISASNSAINPYIFLYFQRPRRDASNGSFWRRVSRLVRESLTCRLLNRVQTEAQLSTEQAEAYSPARFNKTCSTPTNCDGALSPKDGESGMC
ncbi:hypothetical protein MTO96_022229 [Rhipicephalus appendiculatus]